MTIQLTPEGSIVIDGVKGEWWKRNGYIKYTVQTDDGKESFYANDVVSQLTYNITSGFLRRKNGKNEKNNILLNGFNRNETIHSKRHVY